MTEETKRKLPTLMELIDRYVPRHTQAAVMQMSFQYEEQINSLLLQLHHYHERLDALNKHLCELETEYAQATMIRVPYGRITATTEYSPQFMTNNFRVVWQPDPRQMVIAQRHEPLNPEEFPHLMQAIIREFEREFTTTVKDQLKAEYVKLYAVASKRVAA
ncbi:hypothetical protein [Rhizobium rhizogenes]|uniref:hypothetical protein n=1 Tax=Rhizobium rhizogenes TaxID=359 RepID=UPI00157172F6|nr:hypothetical protein [Rhizobium rhizogenes]NTH18437.1 hypothetical protein [Rhizobium rhizogenes]NTH31410.1 hypothetical protein [Rhizobium rhizogenes]